MTIIKKILGLFTGMCAIMFFLTGSFEFSDVILGTVMVVCTILLFTPALTEQEKAEIDAKLQERLKSCTMTHVNGLPIAENINCNVTATDDKFIFSSGVMKFELEKVKITDMCIKTDRDLQQQYVSSVGGAITGAVLFGPLGAIIGGRAKKKKVKDEVHNYFIITYQSDGIKYMGFEVGFNMASANKFISEFKSSHMEQQNISL